MTRRTFVVAFQPGVGHWARMGAIASALRANGHHVIIATSREFLERIKGERFDARASIGPDWTEDGKEILPGAAPDIRAALREHAANIVERFFAYAPQVAEDVTKTFRGNERPDLFVFDYTLFGGPPAAVRLGVPWAAVYGLTVPFRPPGWPPFGSDLDFDGDVTGEISWRALDSEIDRQNKSLYRPVTELWRGEGVKFQNPWRAFADKARLGIVGSIEEADFPWLHGLPDNVRYVGPLTGADETLQTLDDELRAFAVADAGLPLVHVTLGQTFSRQPALLRMIVNGLSGLPCRALVSAGLVAEADWPQASERVLVRRSVPHGALFDHLDALACHGGANTLMKALAAGVPVLVIPLGAEQRSNGARFKFAGLSDMILPGDLTEDAVRATAAPLLDPRGAMRKRAEALAAKSRESGGAALAARLLERLCEEPAS